MSKLLNRREVADRLGVSVDTIKRWERLGKMARIKLPGRTVRYREETFEKWIDSKEVKQKKTIA